MVFKCPLSIVSWVNRTTQRQCHKVRSPTVRSDFLLKTQVFSPSRSHPLCTDLDSQLGPCPLIVEPGYTETLKRHNLGTEDMHVSSAYFFSQLLCDVYNFDAFVLLSKVCNINLLLFPKTTQTMCLFYFSAIFFSQVTSDEWDSPRLYHEKGLHNYFIPCHRK